MTAAPVTSGSAPTSEAAPEAVPETSPDMAPDAAPDAALEAPPALEARNVSVAYGGAPVVREVSLSLARGEIGCLLGASGCGKTTLLRAIAGLEPLSAGEIALGGEVVSWPAFGPATGAASVTASGPAADGGENRVPPEHRGVGMVFQDYALFPHLTVAENIAFGLRRGRPRDRAARVEDLLALVGLAGAARAYPHELSGGQQQRVALARAMAPRPRILLLDEPFSGVDADRRGHLAAEVRALLRRDGITAMLVTHDQMEAFAIADRLGLLAAGQLRQWDTPYRLYHEPADPAVADFIGQGVMLDGVVRGSGLVETALGPVRGDVPAHFAPGAAVRILLRPDDVVRDPESPLSLPIVKRTFQGAQHLYTLGLPGGGGILCLAPSHHPHPPGERMPVRLDLEHLAIFPAPA